MLTQAASGGGSVLVRYGLEHCLQIKILALKYFMTPLYGSVCVQAWAGWLGPT